MPHGGPCLPQERIPCVRAGSKADPMITSANQALEERKQEEIDFFNRKRGQEKNDQWQRYYSNRKFYSVVRTSASYVQQWLLSHCKGKTVLLYGCGQGAQSFYLAQGGAYVIGIDISDVGIEIARKAAAERGLSDRTCFRVMDCENLQLEDNSVDIVVASGVLHHLDLLKAYAEIRRVLRPDGQVLCVEAFGHNPIIQLYRNLTPQLRTRWETRHILKSKDLRLSRQFFGQNDIRYFHLFVLLAVPFRKTRIFNFVLTAMEAVDSVVLRIPLIRRYAWQAVFVLSKPKK